MFIKKKNSDEIIIDFDEKEHKNYIKYIIIAVAILITIISIIIIKSLVTKKTTYIIELKGDKEITIYANTEFEDPGYIAYDNYGNDNTDKLRVVNAIDTSKIGTYEIAYIIGNTIETRKINVIKEKESKTSIYLKGKVIEYYELGTEYNEPGYMAIDNIDGDITDKVIVSGSIDPSKIGSQKITYTVKNSKNIMTSATRTIIMSKSSIILSLNDNNYTRNNIIINMGIIDNLFSYVILPNGEKIQSTTYQYMVTKNGTYTFTKYNSNGEKEEESITVKNIDREPPSGTCKAEVGNNTKITISAKDNTGIKYYKLNGKNYYSNVFSINESLTNAVVTIYDNADNEATITCSIKKTSSKTSSQTPPIASSAPKSSYTAPKSSYTAPKSSYTAPKSSYTAPKSSYTAPKSSYTAPKPSSSSKANGTGNTIPSASSPIPFVNGTQRALKTGDCMKWEDSCYCPTIGRLTGFQFIMENSTSRKMKDTKIKDEIIRLKVKCNDGYTVKGTINKQVESNFRKAFNKICELRDQKIITDSNYVSLGTYNARTNSPRTRCSFHAYAAAIDINADLTIEVNGKKYKPYGRSETEYKNFVKALGNENDKRNINYILWKKAFEPNGFVWGGNWGSNFDGMHFEIRG